MKVDFEDAGPCRKLMHVSAGAEAVRPTYDEVVKVYGAQARVPGFRAGHAPLSVVERRYTKGIEDETKDRLVPSIYREALKQAGITPVAIVDVKNVSVQKERGLSFTVTVDVAPDFKLPKYKKIALKRELKEVADKDVDEAVDRLVQSRARFEAVTGRGVRDQDLVCIDYHGQADGKPVAELSADCQGLGDGKDFWMLCGEREFLPGLCAQIVGAAVGEARTATVRFPDDYHVKAVAGREASYQVTVKAVRERILPTIDAEFLKPFEADSEAALKARVRKDLEEAARRQEDLRLKDEVARFLLANTEFELPQSVVEQETQLAIRSIVRRISSEGGTHQQIEQQQEAIVRSAQSTSKDRVRLSYILSRIGDEEKITVVDADLDARIASMAERYGMPVEQFRAELDRRNAMEGLRSDLRSEKTLDFLLGEAKIKE